MPERGPLPTEAESASPPPDPSARPEPEAAPASSWSVAPSQYAPQQYAPQQYAGPASAPADSAIELDGSFGLTVEGDGENDEAPQPRSRTRRIVLTSILAAALAGAGVLGWASWQIVSQKDAKVTAPAQVAGLRLDDSASGRDTADYLRTAVSAEVDLDEAVGAVYSDGSGHDVLFFGGTTLIWSPGKDLDTAFGLISDDQGSVTNLHDVYPGRYGGTMKCGTTETTDGKMPVCGWADHGSLALAMFPSRTEPDAANLLLQIRDAAQTRQ